MVDTYIAWDGNAYQWPPPDGWVMAGDGRYWPEGQAPDAVATSPPHAQSVPPPPQPVAAPPPGTYGAPPPGAYGAPQPGTYGAPQAAKGSNAVWWILGIFGLFVFLPLAGCVVLATTLNRAGDAISEEYNDLADSTERRTEAEQATAVSECKVQGGIPVASGTVTNQRETATDYVIEIDFYDTGTGSYIGTNKQTINIGDGGDRQEWTIEAPVSGFEGGVRCDLGFNTIRLED